MSFDVAAIGVPGEDVVYEVNEAALQAYAEATDDVAGGPVFAVVPAWRTIAPASRSVAQGDDVRRYLVHYEQDMLLHRPVAPGMTLVSRATPIALLARPNGTSLVIKTETHTEDGAIVNQQYVTEFFRGVETAESIGERAPEHRLEADGDPIATVMYGVSDDQTVRYAAASGDDFAIHLDDEFARQVGLPGRIVHGLCMLAFAGRAVLEAASIDDPRAIKRIAVRFSAPLFPGESVTSNVWRVDGGFGFESLNGEGRPVLKDGRVEFH